MTARQPRKPAKKPPPKSPATPRPNPWDRLDKESGPAWEAFTTYRDMGLRRSTAKVAEELGKSTTMVERWSSRHSWVIRVAAWDTHQDRQWQIEQQHMRRQAAKRNAKVAGAYMDKFGTYVEESLTSLVSLEPKDIAALARIAHQIESAALEHPTVAGHSPHGGHVSGPSAAKLVNVGAVHDLSDEDRRARMLMLRRELDRRLDEHDLPEGHTDPDLEDAEQ